LNDLIVGARGKLKAGKFYVIFGKKDNTTIELSAIASGTGGFVINGENMSNFNFRNKIYLRLIYRCRLWGAPGHCTRTTVVFHIHQLLARICHIKCTTIR
jgi:hypothetical protein